MRRGMSTSRVTAHELLPRNQSTYIQNETFHGISHAISVWSDIQLAADTRQVTLLGLLDMSAEFECVDHAVLLQRLKIGVSLSGSFLTDRTQQVA